MAGEFNVGLTATYRIQFHKDFDFRAGARQARYLRDLGVSHVYASPIMKSKPGSLHGYDVTDFAVINPGARRRGGFSRARRGAGARWESGSSSTSCPTIWRSAAATIPIGSICWRRAGQRLRRFLRRRFQCARHQGKILAPLLGDVL